MYVSLSSSTSGDFSASSNPFCFLMRKALRNRRVPSRADMVPRVISDESPACRRFSPKFSSCESATKVAVDSRSPGRRTNSNSSSSGLACALVASSLK
ncbi:hypothetical protein O181_095754 [Austropuccinia psidii MF-1]|uniref:Uncharacterized protein n=1 Tax=Austropuccinia psidii MF-1 TaxID=1389203 RepID=A0A9Q3PC20_9BASI|nr:hypothetical protein [Austropuccinia psidii MF-1]